MVKFNEMKRIKFVYAFLPGILILAVTFVVCMAFGSAEADFGRALESLRAGDFENTDLKIFLYVRLPRCTGAVLSGLSLAVSGVLIQAVLNNPMAAPNIIGVNSGAGLAVILTVSLLPGFTALIPAAAFAGALFACLLISLIAVCTGAGKITVTLVGIAVTSVLNAAISLVKTLFPNSTYNMTTFSVGGLGGVNIKIIGYVFPVIILCFTAALLLSRNVDILCLGKEAASNLGMNVRFQRFLMLAIASALAGCAVSFAGLIGFVGLVVPHIVRIFVGNRHSLLIPLSALYGAEFVLVSDLACRVLFRPYELPVGIILSFAGGIFFVCLILFNRKENRDD